MNLAAITNADPRSEHTNPAQGEGSLAVALADETGGGLGELGAVMRLLVNRNRELDATLAERDATITYLQQHVKRSKCVVRPDGLINSQEFARRAGKSVACIRHWRSKGYGPDPIQFEDKSVWYFGEEVDDWIRQQVERGKRMF
jgi:predicted DNA-binding transcriptional regulator AlpA